MKNNIEKKLDKVHECTGCQMCSAVCPKDAINIVFDKEGFYKPKINYDLCVNCGLCVKSCYKYDKDIKKTRRVEDFEVYAAISKNDKILKSSTSGGISSSLISSCLEQGYKVVGVEYDYNKDIAITEIACNIDEVDKFKGSKYMQSYTEQAFKKIVEDEKKQKYAIFGTPCHIYALNKWAVAKGMREQFLFVDIFCHGCPSMYLWKKYSNYIKEEMKITKFEKIEFRSKAHGWHEFCNSFYKKDIQFDSDKTINDPFFTIFFDNHVLVKACYDCQLRSTLEYTDIRLGDYWGEKYDLDTKGVSAVVVCTSKGKEIFGEIKKELTIEEANINDLIKAQSYGTTYMCNSQIRNMTLGLLKSDKKMKNIFKEYLNMYTLRKRIYRKVKKSTYILPQKMRYRIKKIYHILQG